MSKLIQEGIKPSGKVSKLIKEISKSHSSTISEHASLKGKWNPNLMLGRVIKQEYVIDPVTQKVRIKNLSKGVDNSKSIFRFNGLGMRMTSKYKELQLFNKKDAMYLCSLNQGLQPASSALEVAHYKHAQKGGAKGKSPLQYHDALNFSAPQLITIRYSPSNTLFINPTLFDYAKDLEEILGRDLLSALTEALKEVLMDGSKEEREELLTTEIVQHLRKGRLNAEGLHAIINSDSYILTPLIGNAILQAGVAVEAKSARNVLVTQPKFVEGSMNYVLPQDTQYCVPLTPFSYTTFNSDDRVFSTVRIEELND